MQKRGFENSDFEVACILCHLSALDKSHLVLEYGKPVNENLANELFEALERRIAGEPLQYILGEWSFMGLDFNLGPGVLIPRRETETLVEKVLQKAKSFESPIIFDLCAGTGCIGISIALKRPDATLYLLEKSEQAYPYMLENIRRYNLSNIKPVKGDLFSGFSNFDLPRPDIIVSNPPYIKSCRINDLQSEVKHEPYLALDGGEDGLDFYRALFEKWFPCLRHGGFMALECADDQADTISKIFSDPKQEILIEKDLFNIERFVFIRKQQEWMQILCRNGENNVN
ncbi:MAG: peptide chain release factor N(5)-glutamine methyltransferase [Clostridiales bacterium]|nr:peptide chain release factor N(5)-glutamine methyltransferase [Clostridiales bacterium]